MPGGEVPLTRDPSEVEGHPLLVLGIGDHLPNTSTAHIDDFFSRHTNGVNCLFGDGSVRSINNNINPVVWSAIQTRHGSEATGLD